MKGKKILKTLSEDDQALWQRVIGDAVPLADPPFPENFSNIQIPDTNPLPQPAPLKPFRIGETGKPKRVGEKYQPDFANRYASVSPNMDGRNYQRLIKGKKTIDGTLDLHGLTAHEAQARLLTYVLQAHATGKRLLLVITGKGKTRTQDPYQQSRGVLKQSVPEWLRMTPLAPLVLQVTQAHAKHGGGGAYYVYLRRQR
jgi:DNA-nicking Smr family endonuclease